jgi:hypothetical protein
LGEKWARSKMFDDSEGRSIELELSIAKALNQELCFQLQDADSQARAWKNIAEMAISAFYNDGGWLDVLEEFKKMKPEEFGETNGY